MKRFFATVLLLFALAAQSFGQGRNLFIAASPEELADTLAVSNVKFDFKYTILQNGFDVVVTGSAEIQNGCYRGVMSTLEFYCDGQTRWTVDPQGKEVYIENARDAASDFLVSPGEYLMLVPDLAIGPDYVSGNYYGEGAPIPFEITSIVITPPADRLFGFDISSLDDDWIITDLR